jgi:hypothetical protein
VSVYAPPPLTVDFDLSSPSLSNMSLFAKVLLQRLPPFKEYIGSIINPEIVMLSALKMKFE